MSELGDPAAVAARSGYLLSRYAESIFWLARYMERIENLARILDVTETFARDDRGGQNWLSVVQINADEQRFFARHERATAQTVTQFYVLDRENPTSIAAGLFYARENARTLRPLISTEMWTQLNVFHNWVRKLEEGDIQPSRLSRLCARLKESCQAHTGITDGTFFRDQGWSFYMIGKFLERGDQTTRLVDIKYHTLLPAHQPVGSPLDESQWNAMLRAAAGYHAFRRIYPRGMAPAAVAGFLLLNNAFPRSLVLCVRQVEWYLTEVRSRYGLRRGEGALERLYGLSTALAQRTIEETIAAGLHEFLDWVQRELILVQGDIADAFWAAGEAADGQGQSQD